MNTRTAIEVILILSGEFDIPGEFLIIEGFDAYGKPTKEKVPNIDWARLQTAVDVKIKEM